MVGHNRTGGRSASLLALVGRFRGDSSGQIAVFFALALIPIAEGIGAAVDYSKANGVKVELQASLDAAVLAGAGDKTSSRDTTATNTFAGNFAGKVSGVSSSPTFAYGNDGTYAGTASAQVPTTFMKVVGISNITVTASAKATIAGVTTAAAKAMCLIALDTTVSKAVAMSGSATIDAPNCLVQVNSNNTDAVDMSGSTTIKSAENCFVGKLKTYSPSSVSPSADATCAALADPFAGLAKPTIGACTYNKYTAPSNSTLQPGVYCGGLTISSTSVTFAPGLYIIKDGDLNVSGTSKMTGNGVTFFLTGSGAGVTSSGGSSWHLVAAGKLGYPCTDGTSGCLAGFVFYLDTSGKQLDKTVLSGGSEMYFEGGMYFPQQQLNLSGGSGNYSLSPFTAIAAGTFNLSSSSAINLNSDPSKTSVPVPAGFIGAGMGGMLRLVQ